MSASGWVQRPTSRPPMPAGLRRRVLQEEPTCRIRVRCNGAPSTEVDHIRPLARGGTHDRANLQGACRACHAHKTASIDSKPVASRKRAAETHPGEV